MAVRNRFESRWTSEDATVKGRRNRNGWWMIVLGIVGLVIVASLLYSNYQGFRTVSFQVHECEEPLEDDASWQDVEAARCRMAETDGHELSIRIASNMIEPDEVQQHAWVFQGYAGNSPANMVWFTSADRLDSAVVVNPEDQTVRRGLSTDASRLTWTGNIGAQGPSVYWILVTPEQAR